MHGNLHTYLMDCCSCLSSYRATHPWVSDCFYCQFKILNHSPIIMMSCCHQSVFIVGIFKTVSIVSLDAANANATENCHFAELGPHMLQNFLCHERQHRKFLLYFVVQDGAIQYCIIKRRVLFCLVCNIS